MLKKYLKNRDAMLRESVETKFTWDLTPIYPSIAAWKEELQAVDPILSELETYQGRLAQSAQVLESALRLYLRGGLLIDRLYTYAHLRSDENTADATALGYLDQATNAYSRFAATSSYISPELLGTEEARLTELLDSPSLQDLRRMVQDIVRYRPHTLSKSEENLLALGTEVFGSAGRIFSQLNNADFDFGSIEVDRQQVPLTHGSFGLLLKNQDRDVRRLAFLQYYDLYDRHRHTLAASLSASTKGDVFMARARKHRSALELALFGENIPTDVYSSLIKSVNAHLPSLHRYYSLRKKLLALQDPQIYDTYIPVVGQLTVRHTFEEACEAVLQSLVTLGEDYCNLLRSGLTQQRWVDVFETKGKRSGAYSSGCFGTPPYILLNFKEDELNDVYTLTHEAGHSMHSYYSRKHQPYQDSDYTIFVAEVASTLNEQLLSAYFKKKHADNRQMLAYIVNHQIDELKSTLFRQTMFAEFEQRIHEIVEQNQALTVDVLRSEYRALQQRYFGPDVSLPPLADLECLRIPHFYSAFYVYKYATGISAAVTLATQIQRGSLAERERYLRFLQSGRSKYSTELLKDAGVDITTPLPVETALKQFAVLVDELQQLVG